jgi:hypothetical protein
MNVDLNEPTFRELLHVKDPSSLGEMALSGTL